LVVVEENWKGSRGVHVDFEEIALTGDSKRFIRLLVIRRPLVQDISVAGLVIDELLGDHVIEVPIGNEQLLEGFFLT
jgi:hypothetical protein